MSFDHQPTARGSGASAELHFAIRGLPPGALGAQRLQPAQSTLVATAAGGNAMVRPFGLDLDRPLELGEAHLLLGQNPLGPCLELVEAPLENAQPAAIEPPHGAAHGREERPVVADHDQTASAFRKLPLEPLDGRQVEMIGGFIEQENVRVADQDAGEIDPPGFTARQLGNTPRRVDAEAIEGCCGAVCVELGFVQPCHSPERRLERAQARLQLGLLRQVGDRAAGGLQAFACVQLDQSGQRSEQGGLAGAVAADQADAIPIRYRRGERREQRCGP